ncbi:MAG TPA: DNA polymerase III subunit gamma/tau, partial [Alphaproteobacteria bacterium]|nr:DNA polymerase III subunit gamma/tau [Alphaproteobacteria bacterium]
HGAMILASNVVYGLELVHLEKGRLEYHPAPDANPKLAQELGKKLSEITGQRWLVSVSMKQGQPTLARQNELTLETERQAVMADPVVARILVAFPNAQILSIEENKEN